MGIVAVVLGVLSMIMMVGGFVLSIVPFVGTVVAFGAPLVALVAVILGGIAMSRAKRDGGSSGAGLAGLIVGIVAFVPALFVALTCGLCNACFSASMLNPHDGGVRWRFRRTVNSDGGTMLIAPAPAPFPAPMQPGLTPAPALPPPAMAPVGPTGP